jgi:hypothetical protein
MSNSDQDAAQKQWELRNSDRRDTFEGAMYGTRTGEVRTIDAQEHPFRRRWSAEAQWGTDGDTSENPAAIRQVHVWPSDVSPPASGALVFAEQVQDAENGRVHSAYDPVSHEDWQAWLDVYTYAADGD